MFIPIMGLDKGDFVCYAISMKKPIKESTKVKIALRHAIRDGAFLIKRGIAMKDPDLYTSGAALCAMVAANLK